MGWIRKSPTGSAGVPINDVQRVMRHEQASTTLDRYTHRSPDGNRRVLGGPAAFSLHPDLEADPAGGSR